MPEPLTHHGFADLWHPGVFAWVALLQAAYLLAAGPFRERFGWGAPVPAGQKLWFSMGLWLIYLAEGTPLHVLSERYLFSAHMLQHVLLTSAMPLLLLAGTPDWMVRPVFGRRPVLRVWRALTRPVLALLLFNLIYSAWHIPGLYQAALYRHEVHMLQHAILVATAFVMWWPVASPLPEAPRLHEGLQMFYAFLVGVAQAAVYALVTYAERPLYGFYSQAPRLWSLTPLADQQLSGVIMKLGGMLTMIVVWLIVFFRWAAREGALGPAAVSEGGGTNE